MATLLGSVPLTVSLTVAGVTGEIGTIDVPIRTEAGAVRAGAVELTVFPPMLDDLRPELAGLLRAAADEIENPTSDEDD